MTPATEVAMCFKRSELRDCVPLPRTSLTATDAKFVNIEASGLTSSPPNVVLYFQDTHGNVCKKDFYYSEDRRGLRKEYEYEGDEPKALPGRTLALFSPLNIVQWRLMPFAYYLDNLGVIIESNVAPGEEKVNLQDLEWIDIKAANWSRIGALSEEERGTWVYYESGREKGIREIWKGQRNGRSQYNFTTFRIPNLLNGTDIAGVQIPIARSGSFFYQHEDFSLWEHNWNNQTMRWDIREILPSHPPNPEHTASPMTSLAAAFIKLNSEKGRIYVHYLTEGNKLGVITRYSDQTNWSAPTIIKNERIMSGSRLGATGFDDAVFVAFQVDRAGIHGLFYFL